VCKDIRRSWVNTGLLTPPIDILSTTHLQARRNKALKFTATATKPRYLRITAKNLGIIPKGSPGEGKPAWLFVDEVKVE